MRSKQWSQVRAFFVTLLCLSVWACATASYDQQADQLLTKVQKNIDTQLVTWQSELEWQAKQNKKQEIPFANYRKFYDDTDVDLNLLAIRMKSAGGNSPAIVGPIVDDLRSQLSDIKKLHQENNNLSTNAIRNARGQFNAQFAALTAYELSLSGGPGSKSSNASSSK